MTRCRVVLLAASLILCACSGTTGGSGGGGGSAGGGTGGSGGGTAGGSGGSGGGTAGGSGGSGGSGGGGGGSGGGTAGGSGGAGGGSVPVVFTPCAQWVAPKVLTRNYTNEVQAATGRPHEAFVAWSEQDTGDNWLIQYVDGGWQPAVYAGDGGQTFANLTASTAGEAHALLGGRYYFQSPGGTFTQPATRPGALPQLSPNGAVALSYESPTFSEYRLFVQRRTPAGVWPVPVQYAATDAGISFGNLAHVDANLDTWVLWSTSYSSQPADGGFLETRNAVKVTKISAAGAASAPTQVLDSHGFFSVQNNLGQRLVATDFDSNAFTTRRMSASGTLSDARVWTGEPLNLALADDGSATLVRTATNGTLTVDRQPSAGGTWTSTPVVTADGGVVTRSFEFQLGLAPNGGMYVLERVTSSHYELSALTAAGTGAPRSLDLEIFNPSPPSLVVGNDGQAVAVLRGSSGADAGFGSVMFALTCQ